ncbi:MAG: 2-deoxyribonucleoside glycosidase [bacterium]|nr:2-deoxyribonucleoside glycosidase [bacterium]
MKLFISSPLGFAESTSLFREPLKKMLTEQGFDVVDPWANAADLETELAEAEHLAVSTARRERLHEISMRIAERNQQAIDGCERMLAILDGVDVDSGTASEIGYAFARGKRIDGYRGDFRRTGENDGVVVNLQVQYWIEKSGGRIFRGLIELAKFS